MGSVMAHWSGRCPRREDQSELCRHIEQLARASHSFYEKTPEIKKFNNKIKGSILLKPGLVEDALLIQHGVKMKETKEEADTWHKIHKGVKTQLIRWPLLDEAHLFGIEFHLYDPRKLYEDRMSFVFLSHEIPVLNGLIVMAEDHDECKEYYSETIQNLDWYLTTPRIHLRYYLENWFDYLMAWTKYFFIPDLYYWRYSDLPDYENLKQKLDMLVTEVENKERLRGIVFEDILERFEFEVIEWAKSNDQNYGRIMAARSNKGYSPSSENAEKPKNPLRRHDNIVENEDEKKLDNLIRKIATEQKKAGLPVTEDGRIDIDAFKGIYPTEEIERDKKWVATVDEIRNQELPSIEKLRARIRAYKHNYDASWFCRGLDLAYLGRYNEALNCFDKAIELDPHHDRAWSFKGLCLAYLKSFDEALNCYNRVIELNPNDDNAKDSRARILARLEKERKLRSKNE
jgi:tetratricopeptide (TPR) repeat protein